MYLRLNQNIILPWHHSLQEKDVMGKQWDDTYVRCSFLLNFTQWVFKNKKKITISRTSRCLLELLALLLPPFPRLEETSQSGKLAAAAARWSLGARDHRLRAHGGQSFYFLGCKGRKVTFKDGSGPGESTASAGANFKVHATNTLAHEGASSTKTWCRFTRICLSMNKPAHQTALQRTRSSSSKLHHAEH